MAAEGPPQQPPSAGGADVPVASLETVQELERRKRELTNDLQQVERQIYDLETAFLESSIGVGQALRGYTLSLTQSSSRKHTIKPGDLWASFF
eukprot:CAMPEP_0117693654 /NCGR_PEP_ID=MMETSP0804-20121206/27002_1 /TAXON_ID=1074897 /ORGANISM="Tetraselmis astigmatica, Strain CCMP880" /LENGTH=92 /DNA_ID=CAMNT_0005507235 /DNA_START=145 /DNA_END=423 /DNA_ORIENTATION=-